MYHYVHAGRTPHVSGLHGPSREEFERQVRALQSQYEIIDYPTLADAFRGDSSLPKKCALITFDDGTADQYQNAFPVLLSLGVSGVFFAITDCVENRALTGVHARHFVTREIGAERFRQEFVRAIPESCLRSCLDGISSDVAQQAYRWDDCETARFKYACNFALPPGVRNRVLRRLFERFVGDWDSAGQELYLTWEQLREMQHVGMQIGGHSHRHEALTRLSPAQLDEDISLCAGLLARRLDDVARPFSYPFGKSQHYSRAVIETLTKHGFHSAFVNEQGLNQLPSNGDGATQYTLRRIDPKDLPQFLQSHGQPGARWLLR